jgi:hypothetical protein
MCERLAFTIFKARVIIQWLAKCMNKILIYKGSDNCHVLRDVRTSCGQRWPGTAHISVLRERVILPQMPIRIHSAILDLSMECQSIFPGILLPADKAFELATESMVGDHSNHCTGFRRQHHLVSLIVHLIHHW